MNPDHHSSVLTRHRLRAGASVPWLLAFALAAVPIAGCDMLALAEQERQYTRDREILVRVGGVLATDRELARYRIAVEVFRQTVTLTGTVGSEAERRRAAELAADIVYVDEVENRIVVSAGAGS